MSGLHSWRSRLMLVWCGATATTFVTLEPLFVGVMIERLVLSHAMAGYVSAALVAASAAGGMLLLGLARVAPLRVFAVPAALVMAAMDLACAFVDSGATLFVLRAASSLAAGMLFAAANAIAAQSGAPARLFAAMLIGQLLLGTLGHFLLPELIASAGLSALFLVLAATCAPVLLGWRLLPAGWRLVPGNSRFRQLMGPRRRIFVSLLLMYTGYMAVWAYLERIGAQAGLSARTLQAALALGMLAGLLGAVLSWTLASRVAPHLALRAGLIAMAAGIVALQGSAAAWLYFVATFLVNAAQVFVIPSYLAQLVGGREGARPVVLAGPVISLGIVLGPLLGALSGDGSGYLVLLTASTLLVALAALGAWRGAAAAVGVTRLDASG